MTKGRAKAPAAGQKRISAKIKHLVDTGEVPNTPAGRKQAAAMAYSMERAHRLTAKGAYKPVKGKGKSRKKP